MDTVFNFCKGAKYIKCSTEQVDSLKNLNIPINLNNDEVWRSIYGDTLNCLFCFNIDLKTKLDDEIYFMKTIEMYYPNVFSWRFNGEHIEAIANIKIKKDNLGAFNRYKTVENFIIKLKKQLYSVLKYRHQNFEPFIINEEDFILATGSVNNKTGMYVVYITPIMDEQTILMCSRDRIVNHQDLKVLNMKFWVREINPDFYKDSQPSGEKVPITSDIFTLYPPCIAALMKENRKGNFGRYLLATFLLKSHNERDAKHQLDSVLNDEERAHINEGDCSGQWRTILTNQYPAPSCKVMRDNKLCPKECGYPSPLNHIFSKFAEKGEELKKEKEVKK